MSIPKLLNIKKDIYPIGSIYISLNSTEPATLFGGVWERIKDRFMMPAGDIYVADSTGGSAEQILLVENMPAHTHTRGTMNITGGFAPWSEGSGTDITQEQGAFYSSASAQYGWGTSTGRDADNEYIYFDASRSWTGETSSEGGGGEFLDYTPLHHCIHMEKNILRGSNKWQNRKY